METNGHNNESRMTINQQREVTKNDARFRLTKGIDVCSNIKADPLNKYT